MAWSTSTLVIATCLLVLVFASPAHAFGAGNIASLSRIEGQNWRHGDIEDTLLTLLTARFMGGKKFSKLDVQRVYFGNWLRDYSQAVDVGTVKYVSAEAIRILLWVLGFMSFGYGTGEFEVTTERLGCYQPTEHIDNPLGYAEGDDARRYDRRLRGPVDERRELAIDPRTGLKSYISSEDQGIDTSAALIRRVLGECIELGRRYARSGRKNELYEALRLLGTGLHCLEDYAAHSNYTELALIEMGERDVFPHVGRRTQIDLRGARGPVYPITTGTFGGVDFFHSVLGEFNDKATQSEIQSLEGVIEDSKNETPSKSLLQDLLDKIPSGIFGGNEDNSGKMNEFQSNAQQAAQNNQNISPREPEEWTRYLNDVQKQIYPVLEWHDNILQQINEAIEKIPVLPDLIEQIQDQISVFVFSVIAPYVLPIINQVKSELETGSSEVIQSSKAQQHIVFNDDNCTNPTHSMLSKDHFSNVLNEPAGKVAQAVVKWVVPQIVQCWDDDGIDVDRTLNRIIYGVFHHPALRDYGDDGQADIRREMFQVVENWWSEQGDRGQRSLRQQLSREGVQNGDNHKPGVHDSGHGSCKPMKLPGGKHPKKHDGGSSSGGLPGAGGQIETNDIGKFAKQAVGGGALGSLVGGFVSDALGGGEPEEPKKHKKEKHYEEERRHGDDGRYVEKKYKEKKYKEDSGDEYYKKEKKHKHEKKYSGDASYPSYSKTEYQRTEYDDGPGRQTYVQRTEYGGGAGYETRIEQTGGYGGGYESRRPAYEGGYGGSTGGYGSSGYAGDEYGRSGGGYGSSERAYDFGYGQASDYRAETQSYGGHGREEGYGSRQEYRGGDGYSRQEGYGSRQQYGGGDAYGRRRSRSRGSDRESRQYQGGYPERDERRHHSRERGYGSGDEYKKRYDNDSEDDDDRKRHHHHKKHHHHRRSSGDS